MQWIQDPETCTYLECNMSMIEFRYEAKKLTWNNAIYEMLLLHGDILEYFQDGKVSGDYAIRLCERMAKLTFKIEIGEPDFLEIRMEDGNERIRSDT